MKKLKSAPESAGCPFKPTKQALQDRPLLSTEQTHALCFLFRTLSNDTRLRLLHALTRQEEMCVSDLADTVEMKAQAVSNQLKQLAAHNIVDFRKDGLQVFYRIADPCIVALLDYALCSAECSMAHNGKGTG